MRCLRLAALLAASACASTPAPAQPTPIEIERVRRREAFVQAVSDLDCHPSLVDLQDISPDPAVFGREGDGPIVVMRSGFSAYLLIGCGRQAEYHCTMDGGCARVGEGARPAVSRGAHLVER